MSEPAPDPAPVVCPCGVVVDRTYTARTGWTWHNYPACRLLALLEETP